MARIVRTCRGNVKYLIGQLLFLLEFCLLLTSGFNYNSDIQGTLCDAQCEASCLDKVVNCRQPCNSNASLNWMTNCDRPSCSGTCSVFFYHYKANRINLVEVPDVNISQSGTQYVELSWDRPAPVNSPDTVSNYSIIYIIEKIHHDPYRHTFDTDSITAWLTDTVYQVPVTDKCNTNMYRVMAINQFGSLGFSTPIQLPGMRPGPVQNISYTGQGIYYYKNKDNPEESNFMAVLQWDPPTGWVDGDVDHYEWNPMVKRYCQSIDHDSLPIFVEMQNHTNRTLMTIASSSIGCTFMPQVRAVSKCGIRGPWTNFTVDLTDYNRIVGYSMNKPFNAPGKVENISLTVSSLTVQEIRRYFLLPKYVMSSPLLVYLHILWSPPSDLGSNDYIDHYIIRSGRVRRNLFPIPPDFIEEPKIKKAPNDTIEMIFTIPTQSSPYTIGIQVIAVAPGQDIKTKDLDRYDKYTMVVKRNDSGIAAFTEGKVLLDRGGIVILYVNNTLPVHFLFDEPIGRMGNMTIDRYAVQWGPLVGPEGNETLHIENQTVVPYIPFDDGPVLNVPSIAVG